MHFKFYACSDWLVRAEEVSDCSNGCTLDKSFWYSQNLNAKCLFYPEFKQKRQLAFGWRIKQKNKTIDSEGKHGLTLVWLFLMRGRWNKWRESNVDTRHAGVSLRWTQQTSICMQMKVYMQMSFNVVKPVLVQIRNQNQSWIRVESFVAVGVNHGGGNLLTEKQLS